MSLFPLHNLFHFTTYQFLWGYSMSNINLVDIVWLTLEIKRCTRVQFALESEKVCIGLVYVSAKIVDRSKLQKSKRVRRRFSLRMIQKGRYIFGLHLSKT